MQTNNPAVNPYVGATLADRSEDLLCARRAELSDLFGSEYLQLEEMQRSVSVSVQQL